MVVKFLLGNDFSTIRARQAVSHRRSTGTHEMESVMTIILFCSVLTLDPLRFLSGLEVPDLFPFHLAGIPGQVSQAFERWAVGIGIVVVQGPRQTVPDGPGLAPQPPAFYRGGDVEAPQGFRRRQGLQDQFPVGGTAEIVDKVLPVDHNVSKPRLDPDTGRCRLASASPVRPAPFVDDGVPDRWFRVFQPSLSPFVVFSLDVLDLLGQFVFLLVPR
mmetsp:Transcript_13294/g.28159  ORF Transcript_13294/g.28159 Transcript_13294/m.28159 type:complete len:216 (-) Transcript_13294:245-892(-)